MNKWILPGCKAEDFMEMQERHLKEKEECFRRTKDLNTLNAMQNYHSIEIALHSALTLLWLTYTGIPNDKQVVDGALIKAFIEPFEDKK